jgi:putative glycosyl hydrolase or carbohydrate binding protein
MKKTLIIFAMALLLFSCDEDKSSNAEIVDLSVISLSSTDLIFEDVLIDTEGQKLYVFLNNNLSDFSFPITLTTDLKLSSGAKTSSIIGNEISFSNSDEVKLIEVEAENGIVKNWYVYLMHRQMQNSGFENWFDNKGMNGENYKEIGSSAVSSIWSTANMATSIYDVHCTQPIMDGSNTLVEITTGETLQVPITAGTVFIGTFNLSGAISNPTDPEQATIFGAPFIFRPTGFKFKYKYQAGENYIQATLNNPSNIFGGFTTEAIEGEDKCSIYAMLEVRDGDHVNEIAYVKMESGTTDDIMTEAVLNFDYTSTVNPTHISIVFSSSTDGHLWRGAVGSTLVVDDLELIYE